MRVIKRSQNNKKSNMNGTDVEAHGSEGKASLSFSNIGDSLMHFLERVFHALGTFIARRPLVTIAISLLFVAICASGIRELKEENRGDKLWVPTDSRAQDDKKVRYE